jgi:hypothetical protein
VVGVGQQHARAELTQLGGRDAFDAPGRADDAEKRRLDRAVGGVQNAGARTAV